MATPSLGQLQAYLEIVRTIFSLSLFSLFFLYLDESYRLHKTVRTRDKKSQHSHGRYQSLQSEPGGQGDCEFISHRPIPQPLRTVPMLQPHYVHPLVPERTA